MKFLCIFIFFTYGSKIPLLFEIVDRKFKYFVNSDILYVFLVVKCSFCLWPPKFNENKPYRI